MRLHNFTQHTFDVQGRHPWLTYDSPIQVMICRNCGELFPKPDCKHSMCLHFMSFGCKGEKPKVAWKHPIKDRRIDNQIDNPDRKDYPAKRQGNEAKKRRR